MRTAIVALLALVAVAAAGMWGLAQFGGPTPMKAEEQVPVAKAASVGPAPAAAPLAPPQIAPGAAHPNATSDLKTEKPKADASAANASAKVAAATPAPKPDVAAPPPPPPPPPPAAAATATPAPAAEAKPADALKAAARKAIEDKLKTVAPPPPAPTIPTTTASLSPGYSASPSPSPSPSTPPSPAAVNAPPPELVQTASAPPPAAKPAATPVATATATPDAATPSLADQFKTRKVAYNRPPAVLYLDRPIDISLVIDATAAADPAAQLQGFPGQVVERDVSLSNSVSARLTGVGFDITSQNPGAERQVLSTATPNRWQWRVTPTEPGTHTLTLDIFGYKANSLDAEPLDAYRDQITVQVQQLDSVIKWAKGIQPLFAVIAALAGLMSALIAVLRFRRDGKKSG